MSKKLVNIGRIFNSMKEPDAPATLKEPVKKSADVVAMPRAPALSNNTSTKPAKIKKYLTIMEAQTIKKTSALYVINNTSNVDPLGKRSDIIIDVSMPHGENGRIVVPDTWMPINVGAQVQRKLVLNDRLFMRAIEKDIIKIVSDEWAEKQLKHPDIVDEQQRLALRETQEIINAPIDADGSGQNTGVSMHVIEIFNRVMSARERLATLKNIEGALTDADYHYIMMRSSSPQEGKIKKWCEQKRLNRKRSR